MFRVELVTLETQVESAMMLGMSGLTSKHGNVEHCGSKES